MEKLNDECINSMQECTLAEYLGELLAAKKLSKKEVFNLADIDNVYGYQIFKGLRNPNRNILLRIAFGMSLTLEEADHLLYYGGSSSLYARDKRDAYIMYTLHNHYTVTEANEYLYNHNLDTI